VPYSPASFDCGTERLRSGCLKHLFMIYWL
jgi:hypothetical protein